MSIKDFEPFLNIVFFQRFEQFARFTRQYLVEGIKRQVDSVVGNAVLREVICSDFLAAVAEANHSFAFRVAFGYSLALMKFIKPASQYSPRL